MEKTHHTCKKKLAMALSELIMTNISKDTLDVIVFGKRCVADTVDLPIPAVGLITRTPLPGLELAMDILRRRENQTKIFL